MLPNLVQMEATGDYGDTNAFGKSTSNVQGDRVKIDDLIAFLFPENLQHPLVAGRLIVYGLYGPLDDQLRLRTGPKKRNVVSDWQLDLMCIQVEREDILCVYLHDKAEMPLLTKAEEEIIISQADKHLKSAKGRAMLPVLSRQDVIDILKGVPRDHNGEMKFHNVQAAILRYRDLRVKNYKMVFPRLGLAGASDGGEEGHDTEHEPQTTTNRKRNESTRLKGTTRRRGKVSAAVAPPSMFQSMKGANNADVVQTSNRYLNLYASKITQIDGPKSGISAVYNVRLLREVEPKCPDPYISRDGSPMRQVWNDTSQLTRTGLGSLVNAAPSSTTWKRNATLG